MKIYYITQIFLYIIQNILFYFKFENQTGWDLMLLMTPTILSLILTYFILLILKNENNRNHNK